MIPLAAALTTILLTPIEDYYPLVPGTHLIYEDAANGVRTEDVIGTPVEIRKDFIATPVRSKIDGRDGGSLFYVTRTDTVSLVAYQAPQKEVELMVDSQPILKVTTESKSAWTFQSQLTTGLGPILVSVTGNVTKGKKMMVLGKELETINAKIVSKIGTGAAATEIKQDAIYAKGTGLVELSETSKASGRTSKRTLKLVKFEPPKID